MRQVTVNGREYTLAHSPTLKDTLQRERLLAVALAGQGDVEALISASSELDSKILADTLTDDSYTLLRSNPADAGELLAEVVRPTVKKKTSD